MQPSNVVWKNAEKHETWMQAEVTHQPAPNRPKYITVDNRISKFIVVKYGAERANVEYLRVRTIADNL